MNLLFDIETDGLTPTVIHMIGIIDLDTNKYFSFNGDDVAEAIVLLSEADLLVGHNVLGYDIRVMEKLTGGLVKFDTSRVVDTLPLARDLIPGLANYKLSTLGKIVGLSKLEAPSFQTYTPLMETYCRRDCEVSALLFHYLMERLDE